MLLGKLYGLLHPNSLVVFCTDSPGGHPGCASGARMAPAISLVHGLYLGAGRERSCSDARKRALALCLLFRILVGRLCLYRTHARGSARVAEHAWRSGDAPKLKKALLRGLVPAILMIVLMGLLTSQSRGIDAITSFLLLADGSVRLAIWALALFILFFCQWQGVSERALDFGIVAGFLLFSSLHLLVVNAMSHPTLLRHSTLSAINSGAYLAATLIWLGYAILAPKDARVGSADAACLA
jgi:hypothetical protein